MAIKIAKIKEKNPKTKFGASDMHCADEVDPVVDVTYAAGQALHCVEPALS